MYRQLALVAMAIGLSLTTSPVLAQCSCDAAPAPCVSVGPRCPTYYTPPVTNYPPVSCISHYAPAPQVAYYTPVAQPAVAYYGKPGRSIYGTPKVYVPGEPIRNILRAITP
jgi:hypothetical protein